MRRGEGGSGNRGGENGRLVGGSWLGVEGGFFFGRGMDNLPRGGGGYRGEMDDLELEIEHEREIGNGNLKREEKGLCFSGEPWHACTHLV